MYTSSHCIQTDIINQCGLFGPVIYMDSQVVHQQSIEDCIEAWRSHGTLQRQADYTFDDVINSIALFLKNLDYPVVENNKISIPYTTKIWMAQLK